MNVLSVIIVIFAVLGAADFLFGSKLGVGKEFEKAFALFGPMALSMLGMIVIAHAVGEWLMPAFDGFYKLFGIDPSIIPASLFANDMGGAALSQSVCKSEEMGGFHAMVVASMMGCIISFTIPFALGVVQREQRKPLFFGLLCGIVTIPVGCFGAGLLCGLSPLVLLVDLIPLILLSALVAVALILIPRICIKCFEVFGYCIKVVAVAGLACAIVTFLTGFTISPHFERLENAAMICVNACVTLAGALPLMYLVGKLLHKPLQKLSGGIGIDPTSAVAFTGTLVTNATTFGMMDRMNKKGVALNAAFAVSASFVFGDHLAFTMAYDARYVTPMIVGKLTAGVFAVLLAALLYREHTDSGSAVS